MCLNSVRMRMAVACQCAQLLHMHIASALLDASVTVSCTGYELCRSSAVDCRAYAQVVDGGKAHKPSSDVLTSRCLAIKVLPSKASDTTATSKLDPHLQAKQPQHGQTNLQHAVGQAAPAQII